MPVSTRPYMGATAFDGGVTFRVWAPNARTVSVAGEFNQWSKTASPLSSEENGYWSADEEAAKPGQQYKFVIINRDSGAELWKNDPYARELTQSNGNSIIAATDTIGDVPGYGTPAANEAVIYELHVGSFLFDRTLPDPHGTFTTLITRLDYLRDLGINVIEIMAAGEFATDFSWGYNQAYMFAIEHAYGGPNGFRDLVREAHKRGIAVLFDVVYNHIGPDDCDLWQFDGWSENNQGGIYFYNDNRNQTPWGMNRPDYGRSEVRQYLRDNALRWTEQRFVDGIRWDGTGWIRNIFGSNDYPPNDIPDGWSLMQHINNEIRARQPWKFSIAEDMQQNEWLTRDTDAGGAGFTSQWDAGFVHPIRGAIVPGYDGGRDMGAVQRALELRYNGDVFRRVIYTESHDEDANGSARVPEEIWPGNADSYFSRKRSTLGAALVFTAPGIPMIFQGQEFLEDRYFRDDVELDWSKTERHAGIVDLYRDLIRLRRNWFNNTRGLRGQGMHIHHRNDADKLIAFHRWDQGGPGDDVVVVANFANRSYDSYSIGFPRAGLWWVRFNSDYAGYGPDFGNQQGYDTVAVPGGRDDMPCAGNIGIGPYSVLILSQ
ncbi:MAG TPA: alpha-amylase family glycosyl hydrolase [Nitrosospira sp.]|nr:alpha-amylase family glycosyl hydrolase [Nitrosospira sp.]